MKKYNLFLKELSEISQKYGIYISGCGCCNSPYLVEHEPDTDYMSSELVWDNKEKKYFDSSVTKVKF